MTLYEILGVKCDATPDQINKAYRKKIKEKHPDRGGTTEEVNAVKQAFRILHDPETRAHYDATGEIREEKNVSTEQGKINSIISAAMPATIAKKLKNGMWPSQSDLAVALRGEIGTEIAQAKKNIEGLGKSLEALKDCKDRFIAKDPDDTTMNDLVNSHVLLVEAQQKNIQVRIDLMDKACEYLKNHTFKIKPDGTWGVEEEEAPQPKYRMIFGGFRPIGGK